MAAPDVYRIADNQIMDEIQLTKYIAKNDEKVAQKYEKLQKAYKTDYDIFHQAKKPDYKPDNRIAVNFAKYITDTMNGFFIGIPIKVSSKDSSVDDYINYLDVYNGQDDNNAELAKTMKIYGRGYEMYFVDEEGNIGITYLDPMEAFMIYDESILMRPRYFVRIYKDTEGIRHGSISNETTVRYFDIDGGLRFRPDEERLHGFDGVPATEYIENSERQGIFESVLSMIDAYNKALSEKANDVDYFADAYMKILGAKLSEPELQAIRDMRILNFEGEDGSKIIADFMSKPSADTTQENLLERIERLIFLISMVANINDENFGTSSGIALKYKLQSMNNLAKTEERKFTSGMNQRYKLIFSNPVSGMKTDDWLKIDIKFTRNFPANELEESQIAGNLSGITSKETQLKVLSVVDNVNDELDRIKEENELDTEGYEVNRGVLAEQTEAVDQGLGEERGRTKEEINNSI
jgi:SPP1 family phage portal protein|uniref:PORTAL PROTEIN n=1 Tax=Siphoviridae sp. ctJLm32 TaxID=2825431 RepID=A0A8S5UE58_9CAUD|nr:MAG TPA: PORTAL PROTEIN [Siphoviridae sp. ctJLm32]